MTEPRYQLGQYVIAVGNGTPILGDITGILTTPDSHSYFVAAGHSYFVKGFGPYPESAITSLPEEAEARAEMYLRRLGALTDDITFASLQAATDGGLPDVADLFDDVDPQDAATWGKTWETGCRLMRGKTA